MPIEAMKPCRERRTKRRKAVKTMLSLAEVIDLIRRQSKFLDKPVRPIGATEKDFMSAYLEAWDRTAAEGAA